MCDVTACSFIYILSERVIEHLHTFIFCIFIGSFHEALHLLETMDVTDQRPLRLNVMFNLILECGI